MQGTKMQVKMADIATEMLGKNGQTSHRLHDLTLTVTPGIGYGAVVDVFDGTNPMKATHASLYLSTEQVRQLIEALKETVPVEPDLDEHDDGTMDSNPETYEREGRE